MENFIAIDFETARPERSSACAVGIVKVIDGVITEKYFTLIKPLNNEYFKKNTLKHGIDAEMTVNCKSFYEVYPVIKNYIEGQLVIAHNAQFDTDVLTKTMELYGITEKLNYSVICTCELNEGKRLKDCCKEYNIELEHHNPLSDAEACAILYMKTKGIKIIKYKKEVNEVKEDYSKFKKRTSNKKLMESFNLDEVKNKNTILFGKTVLFTGELSKIPLDRDESRKIAIEYGATIREVVSKNINIIIIGDKPGESKLQKIENLKNQGKEFIVLNEEEFKKIVNL